MAKVLIGNFKGPQGEQGVKGDPGTAATIQVGTTQTVQPEANAEVTNTGTANAAVLNFKIPRGEDGMTDLTAEYKDASEYTCEPTVNAPVVVKGLDGKTEQGENPTPDNPQVIKGVGGTGYFDGEWVQGNISSTGAIGTETTGITSANAIPCKQNDNIAVAYEDSIDAIAVAFYNASGAYISTITSGNSVDTFTATAPANAASFKVNLRVVSGSTITPSTAKYCTVTINGEYQTRVEVTGKNLFDRSKSYENSVLIWLNGTISPEEKSLVSDFIKTSKGRKYVQNYKSQVFLYDVNKKFIKYIGSTEDYYTTFSIPDGVSYFRVGYRSSENGGIDMTKANNIMLHQGVELSGYIPYQSTTLTIPLTSPLYEGDKICYVKPGESYVDADGTTVVADGVLYGCYRENAVVVFDGSGDENWGEFAGGNNRYYIDLNNSNNIYTENTAKCNFFKYNTNVYINTNDEIGFIVSINRFFCRFGSASEINSASNLKVWLSTNPLTVVYRLAQPYFEPFADQSIFYDLRTDDTLTYIYSSDPIEPNVTVEVAKNSTGGYLLESYAQAQKNAISEANSQSRISAIEQQLVNQATTPTE